jgi:hypothetical protein
MSGGSQPCCLTLTPPGAWRDVVVLEYVPSGPARITRLLL